MTPGKRRGKWAQRRWVTGGSGRRESRSEKEVEEKRVGNGRKWETEMWASEQEEQDGGRDRHGAEATRASADAMLGC